MKIMAKKFWTKEVRIGVAFVVTLALFIYGANFLKGINLFSPTRTYYLTYDNLDGLVVSNGVYIKGYKVGQVKDIKYDFKQEHPFTVEVIINDDIDIPVGSVCYLYDASMLGGKGINIVFSDAEEYHKEKDMLTSDVEVGLMGQLAEVVPDIRKTIADADSTIVSVNNLINSDEIRNTLANVDGTMRDVRSMSTHLDYMIRVKFPPIINNVDSAVSDLQTVTSQLRMADYRKIMTGLDTTMQNLQQLTEKINSPDGTIGQLLTNRSLYDRIDQTVESANALVVDLKANPKRYVHFSLFGAKEKKENKK